MGIDSIDEIGVRGFDRSSIFSTESSSWRGRNVEVINNLLSSGKVEQFGSPEFPFSSS